MQRRNVKANQIMQFMSRDSLRLYKMKGSNARFDKVVAYEKREQENKYKRGSVFVTRSKADLSVGRGYVVTSYESLYENSQELSHWTPNIYLGGTYYDFKKRIIKGHTKDNLKQINVIGFDIDTKDVDLYGIFLGCEELGLPRPNLLLETPRGFQGFFVLETPFYINQKTDYKALKVAERLSENILKALKTYVPVDMNCNPFGFYRIPRDTDVVYFDDKPANTKLLLSWSKQFEKETVKSSLHVVYSKDANASAFDQTSSDWYRALIRSTHIHQGHDRASRNNTLLTLAIANYASGVSYEEAYDELDIFNSNLDHPLNIGEFERILKSAFSGKYKGAKRSYVEGLLELWTDGSVNYQGRQGWYKFKKERKERKRSHYDEREEDILSYLEAHSSPEKPFLEGSLRVLAETFGMAVSTLKEVFKRSTKLIKRTIGHGRGAISMVSSRSMLFRSLLLSRKKRVQHAQITFAELLPEANKIISPIEIPDIQEELLTYEVDLIYRTGAAPPIKMTS